MTHGELIKAAQLRLNVCLYLVHLMHDGCAMVTDSGGRRLWVVGTLDSGLPFVERVAAE